MSGRVAEGVVQALEALGRGEGGALAQLVSRAWVVVVVVVVVVGCWAVRGRRGAARRR